MSLSISATSWPTRPLVAIATFFTPFLSGGSGSDGVSGPELGGSDPEGKPGESIQNGVPKQGFGKEGRSYD